jgi:glutamyl-tRNA reductase
VTFDCRALHKINSIVSLALVHQTPGSAPLPASMPLWRTCLREIGFVDDGAGAAPPAALRGVDAYALLLEIVCGLRSPLVGETEVQAQFKSFLASLDPIAHGWLLRLGQRVLGDAKLIRHRYLQGFGTHSYGHLVRDLVPAGRHVVLVGTGTLAAELDAALEASHPIQHWGRVEAEPNGSAAAEGDRRAARKIWTIRDDNRAIPSGPISVIVAAPIAAADLERIIRRYDSVSEVIDLRARDVCGSGVCGARTITLDDVFATVGTSADAAARVDAARVEVRRLADAFGTREELRPFGWDDLCA